MPPPHDVIGTYYPRGLVARKTRLR